MRDEFGLNQKLLLGEKTPDGRPEFEQGQTGEHKKNPRQSSLSKLLLVREMLTFELCAPFRLQEWTEESLTQTSRGELQIQPQDRWR